MTIIAWIMASKVGRALAAAAALFLAVVTFGAAKKREGRKQAESKAKEADNDRANEIRNDVERGLAFDELHKHDDAGWRD